jgi:hypothetical protein
VCTERPGKEAAREFWEKVNPFIYLIILDTVSLSKIAFVKHNSTWHKISTHEVAAKKKGNSGNRAECGSACL